MNTFSALVPISRRALKIPYDSPLICQLSPSAGYSGAETVSTLDMLPTLQAGGPALLSVELTEENAVRLSWSEVENAYGYIIYRATVEEGPYTVLASGVVPRFFVDNAPPGTYFYKTTAIEPNWGETTASNVVTITVS